MRIRELGAALVAAALLAGCGLEPTPLRTATAANPPTPTVSPDGPTPSPLPSILGLGDGVALFAAELKVPWGLAQLPSGEVLVTERGTGRILFLDGVGGVKELARLPVAASGEGGLLGITAAPDRSFVYVYYTTAQDNRIARFPIKGGGEELRLGGEQVILTGIPRAEIHNGGQLGFGPDGYLYATTGDAGNPASAQDITSLAGKILRLTARGGPADGNPFGNEVWSYGHRNVQGIAWDDRGRMWASEFGQSEWDELNLIGAGKNYGWPRVEGKGNSPELTNPVLVWKPSEASPSGLAYWKGSLWMASLRGERLWEIPLLPGGTPTPPPPASPTPSTSSANTPVPTPKPPLVGSPISHWAGVHGRIRAVLAAKGGAALYVSTSNTDGRGKPRQYHDLILKLTRPPAGS